MSPELYHLYIRAILVMTFLTGLLIAVLWLLKRFNLISTGGIMATRAGGKIRRLGVVETLTIDARRKLVLIRRDGVEHLLVVGAAGETLIETGIPVTIPAGPE